MDALHLCALVLVTVAALYDLKTKRIPNALTYSSWALGFALSGIVGGAVGLADAGLGFLVGFVPMLFLYMGGSIGGGDVKLMGGVGALLGFPTALNALISAILAGGFFAALILLWQGRLIPVLRNAFLALCRMVLPAYVTPGAPGPPPAKDSFPFGVAIALGVYLTVASLELDMVTPADLFR